jgi:hypothetical protein
MLLVVFVAIVPLAVFFGVLFTVMNGLEKRLPEETRSVPLGYYAVGFVVAALCGFVTLAAVYLIAFDLDRRFGAMAVQAALDEQCGKGKYVVDAKGYSSDPYPNWYGDGASCYILDSTQKDWICECPTATDEQP